MLKITSRPANAASSMAATPLLSVQKRIASRGVLS